MLKEALGWVVVIAGIAAMYGLAIGVISAYLAAKLAIYRHLFKTRLGSRTFTIGTYVHVGSSEKSEKILEEVTSSLARLKVALKSIHAKAGHSLYESEYWHEKTGLVDGQMVDLLMVGDLRSWKPMEHPGSAEHRFYVKFFYPHNGAKIETGDLYYELSYRTESKRLVKVMARKCELQIIKSMLTVLKVPNPPAPEFYYDTTQWPFDEHV